MVAPFLPSWLGLCPRLVSAARGCGEDCPVVAMVGHTGPLPPLTSLEGGLSHACPSGRRLQSESAARPQGTKWAGPRRREEDEGAVCGPGSRRLFWPGKGLRKFPQQRVEIIGWLLGAHGLVSTPTIGVGVWVARGRDDPLRVALGQFLLLMSGLGSGWHWTCLCLAQGNSPMSSGGHIAAGGGGGGWGLRESLSEEVVPE